MTTFISCSISKTVFFISSRIRESRSLNRHSLEDSCRRPVRPTVAGRVTGQGPGDLEAPLFTVSQVSRPLVFSPPGLQRRAYPEHIYGPVPLPALLPASAAGPLLARWRSDSGVQSIRCPDAHLVKEADILKGAGDPYL